MVHQRHPDRAHALERLAAKPEPTLLVDPDSRRILAANEAADRLYGYSDDELVGSSLELIDPDMAKYPGRLGGVTPVWLLNREHRRKDGGRLVVDIGSETVQLAERPVVEATIRVAPASPGPVEIARIHQAMAEVNRAALAAASEDVVWDEACRIVTQTAGYRMASIANAGPDGTFDIRVARGAVGDYLEPRRRDLSDPHSTPTGRAASEQRTVVVDEIADLPDTNPNKEAALRNGYRSACLIPLLDGDTVFGILAVFAGQPRAIDPGQVALLERLALDLALAHALFAANRAVRDSEERYRLLVERAADAITLHDTSGRILDANPAACELVGVPRDRMLGRRLEDFATGLRISWSEEAWRALTGGASVTFEQRVRRQDGRVLVLDVRARWLPEGVVEAVSRDVTAQRQLEAQLAQAAKMEAVGQLAGGIAHDFNNILTAVGGYASLVRAGLPADSPLLEDVREIEVAATRAASLTSQLLAFGRRSMLEPRVVDVRGVIAGLEPMLRRLIGEDVTLDTSLGDRPAMASVDPGRLEHALVNLAVNARNAMPEGGLLRLDVRSDVDGAAEGPGPGAWTVIAIEDTGVGIPAEELGRIFEPFYTTRSVGEGTGLGLAMVDGFMRQSGGEVRVASRPGEGTTFWLWLPAVDGAPESAVPAAIGRPARDAGAAVPGGRHTVLVVEDEPVLRRLAQRALKRVGIEVLVAKDGEDALRVAAVHAGRIDLLFSDVVMPGMRGPALALALRERLPGLRVLFTSGYTQGDVEGPGTTASSDGFLAKPYSPRQLVDAVTAAIERQP